MQYSFTFEFITVQKKKKQEVKNKEIRREIDTKRQRETKPITLSRKKIGKSETKRGGKQTQNGYQQFLRSSVFRWHTLRHRAIRKERGEKQSHHQVQRKR